MGLFDELKSDGLKSAGMLGGVLGFVFLFWLWSIGTWAIMLVAILAAGIFVLIKFGPSLFR